MFIWQSNVSEIGYLTQIKELIGADFYEQILQNVRDGDWAATEDLEGTFRRFAEELCTDTKEVLGNHLRRKTTHKLNDYEVAAILNDWYTINID